MSMYKTLEELFISQYEDLKANLENYKEKLSRYESSKIQPIFQSHGDIVSIEFEESPYSYFNRSDATLKSFDDLELYKFSEMSFRELVNWLMSNPVRITSYQSEKFLRVAEIKNPVLFSINDEGEHKEYIFVDNEFCSLNTNPTTNGYIYSRDKDASIKQCVSYFLECIKEEIDNRRVKEGNN